MKRNSEQLTKQLLELRKAIKRKYKIFKEGAEESDIMLEKQYKPIIQELRKKTSATPDIKTEPKEEPMEYDTTDEEITPRASDTEDDIFNPAEVSTPKASELSQVATSPSTSQYIEEYFENPTTRDYMGLFLKDTAANKIIDYDYGPRYMDGQTLMVGDKTMDFDQDGNIKIGGVNYGASEGLYELLFKKVPDSRVYTTNDLQVYKAILIATNAHKKGYKFNGHIKRNKNTKYTRIIRDLFPSVTGKGLAWKSFKTRDIIHWDDANELVDRLRHIAMSTETGNRVHGNEILSIVEELREAGYIKGAGNSRYKALLK